MFRAKDGVYTPQGYQEVQVTSARDIDTVSFPVEGMTCAACVNRITRYLANVDGVEDANVNLATETATVRFDRGRVGLDRLGDAVEAAGYEARIDRAVVISATGSENTKGAETEKKHWKENSFHVHPPYDSKGCVPKSVEGPFPRKA